MIHKPDNPLREGHKMRDDIWMLGCGSLFALLLGCQPIPPATPAPPAAPIPPVPFEPFADGQASVVIEPMSYSIENTGQTITVPAGFVTDFASTPRAIWSFLPPFGNYQKAAVVHDYLYWMQDCTKNQSDKILLIAMTESNVSQRDRWVIYNGVRIGGQSAWDQNAADRMHGLTRFVLTDHTGHIQLDPNEIWQTYRKTHSQTYLDRKSPTAPSYCAVADQISVSSVK
jgi:hypothetical protein